jgi:hypothetical protein
MEQEQIQKVSIDRPLWTGLMLGIGFAGVLPIIIFIVSAALAILFMGTVKPELGEGKGVRPRTTEKVDVVGW